MLTKLQLGQKSLLGISLGGVYTSILSPEISCIFDAGMSPRSFIGAKNLLISHGHADHIGSLPSMIGLRGLARLPAPNTYVPIEIADDIREGLRLFNTNQRRVIDVPIFGLAPGDEFSLGGDLVGRAFRTLHSVPSLGYELFHRVQKLRPAFQGLAGAVIAEKRKAGEDMFETIERGELAYVTDTLIDVLDQHPSLYKTRTLILECTFLDDSKSSDEARQKSHVHLDEILQRADLFENEHVVLMHFSQTYQPRDVHRILRQRLPKRLRERVAILAEKDGIWPG